VLPISTVAMGRKRFGGLRRVAEDTDDAGWGDKGALLWSRTQDDDNTIIVASLWLPLAHTNVAAGAS